MKSAHTSSIIRLAPLLALFAASLLPVSLHAQTNGTWTNTTGGTWGTASNWSGSAIASGAGATADFSTLDITANETVTLDASYTVGNLIFADTSGSSTWTIAGNSTTILTLAATGTPTITATTAATISAPLQGTQGFTKNGAGVLTINSGTTINTLSGPIEVAAGTLTFGTMDSISGITSAITVDSGASLNIYGNFQNVTATNNITLNSGSTFNVNGNALYSGQITLNGDATIAHVNANGGTIGGTITGGYTLTLHTGYGGQPDLIVNAAIQTGTGGLIVNALNTQQVVLNGNNTYTGATTVQAGHLIMNGKLTSAVTVDSGATFGGTGSSTQGISVLSGGFITGGAVGAVGTFTTTGAVSLASGATYSVDFNSSTGTFDKLVASGFSLNGATLSLTDANSTSVALTLGTTYTIMSGSSSITGTFSGLAEGSLITIGNNTFQISYAAAGGDNVTLTTVSAIPEPATTALLIGAVVALGCAIIRRRA